VVRVTGCLVPRLAKLSRDRVRVCNHGRARRFFTTAAVFLSLLFLENGKSESIIIALILCGLASATKYNSALIIIVPSIALLVRYVRHPTDLDGRSVILLPVVPLVTFLIAMPYAILDSVGFLNGVGTELRHYKVIGHPGATTEPGLRHIVFN
jgi:hypothetical protein